MADSPAAGKPPHSSPVVSVGAPRPPSSGWYTDLPHDVVLREAAAYFRGYGHKPTEPKPSPTRESPGAHHIHVARTLDVDGVAVSSSLEVRAGERVRQTGTAT